MTTAALPLRVRARPARASMLDRLAFVSAMLIILIYSQAWEFPLMGADESSDSGLIRALFLPAYAAGVFLLALTPLTSLNGLVRQPFLIGLIAIVCLSILWSVAPDQTERRIFALTFTTLGGVVLAARFTWAELSEVIAGVFALLAVLSLGMGLFVPSLGRMTTLFPGAWRGLWAEKNAFGDIMALGAAFCGSAALLNPSRARLWWGAAALSVLLVVLSTSKTSLVSVLLGTGALVLVGAARRGPATSVTVTWATVVGLGLVAALVFFAADALFGLLGKDATLTGRTKIWAAVMRQINERPWTGFGYGAIWDETDRWGPLAWIVKDSGFRPHHAHNSWLEQWLALGVPGLAAWIGFYLQTLAANVVALYRQRGAYLALPFFVIYTLTTLTESIAVAYNDMRWVIFVAFAVKLALPDQPRARNDRIVRPGPVVRPEPLGRFWR